MASTSRYSKYTSKVFKIFIILMCLTLLICYYTSPMLNPDAHVTKYNGYSKYIHPICSEVCNQGFHGMEIKTSPVFFKMYIHASLRCSLCVYNQQINGIRANMFKNYQKTAFKNNLFIDRKNLILALGTEHKTFLKKTETFLNVQTVYLSWLAYANNSSLLPIKEFYPTDFPLNENCTLENTSDECRKPLNGDIKESNTLPMTMIDWYNVSKPVRHMPGHPEFLAMLHVIRHGIINDEGHVYTVFDNKSLGIIPYQCKATTLLLSHESVLKRKHYQEVFVISQVWGPNYFHMSIENLSRLIPFLQFLKFNTQIKIHVLNPALGNNFELLGLHPDRIVMGTIEAAVVYVPQGGGCGAVPPVPLQILSQTYRKLIAKHDIHVKKEKENKELAKLSDKHYSQNLVILIQRKHKRWLVQHKAIQIMLQKVLNSTANLNNRLLLKIFRDNPSPTYSDTISLFSQAVLVVAPHGAGLANVIYSHPGLNVIEILPTPRSIGCFWSMCMTLGHRYIGLNTIKPGKKRLVVDMPYLEALVTRIVKNITNYE